jgi:endonuclease/exonuclease/phosphatase family metal-dependent hydrolase
VTSLVALILGIMLLVPVPGLANFANPTDPLTGSQPTIRILTLNVMQNSPGVDRDVRFTGIANYLQTHQVHALALQELSGGLLDTPPTNDSGADLAAKLGGEYGYYTESAFGYSYLGKDYLLFKVGVMPRYPMEYHSAAKLDPPGENYSNPPYSEFNGRANAVACGLHIPGFGRVNLISTHIYSDTTLAQKEIQVTNLLKFANDVASAHPARATIVAGDMNFALSPDTQGIYDIFLKNGFIDSYRKVNSDAGSTYGVAGDPYTTPGTPVRIDFIFVKGNGLQIVSSQVVFDGVNGDYVSDHLGVLTEIRVRSTPPFMLLLGSAFIVLAGGASLRRKKP